MFDLDQFVADCRAALAADRSQKSLREVVTRAVSDAEGIRKTLGEPTRGGLNKLHCAPDLTVLHVVWAPRMTVMPHNHGMWAVIGVYGGREDNIFWRRTEGGTIEAAGACTLGPGQARPLGRDIIHSVTNPLPRLTAAIHVYGGDFFAAHRSEWEPETLTEQPSSGARAQELFEEANRLYERA